jgi:hypothetical protein
MREAPRVQRSAVVFMLLALSAAEARAEKGAEPELRLKLSLTPTLIDYEMPGHPSVKGGGDAGAVASAALAWTIDPHVVVDAGVLARVPFAVELDGEAGVLPILTLLVRPLAGSEEWRDALLLRFGSLDTRHGYHPAVVDEARYAYGRPYRATYLASLPPGVERELSDDPFMPAEHGAQLIAETDFARAEVFLDWQLLETREHREKFAFGVLGALVDPIGELAIQFRLVHYGGEQFTRTDPVRFEGFDPVRQPTTIAIAGKLRPLSLFDVDLPYVAFEVPAAYVRGRLAQRGGEDPRAHQGVEVGLDAIAFDVARIGWRLWAPLGDEYGFVSEDGDPLYAGRRSHRARFALNTQHGFVAISGRLDLVFMEGADKVQYQAVTTATLAIEPVIWSASHTATTQDTE